ncbi:hypothetical protein ABPG74_018910 [Tetrahymena malaccensis]
MLKRVVKQQIKQFRKSLCSVPKYRNTELARFFNPEDSEIIEKLFRGKHRVQYSLQKGQVVSNFHVEEITFLKEFNIRVYTLRHKVTQARYIHLDSCDMNNSFAIVLRTPSENDKGIPLMTQRLVMSGSEMYPVKEVLSHMAEKRSMNTFSEPWTGPEFTVFPFSTTNEKDFYNLMGVYIQSVFYPLNRRLDFLQEGVRLEYDEETNPKLPISLRGKTYEEMYNNEQMHDHIFLSNIQQKIYKGSHYSNLGSGTVQQIRNAQYQEVIEYYEKYYSPNNANFFSYGDLDFTKHLEFIDQALMKGKEYKQIVHTFNQPEQIQYIQDNNITCPSNSQGSIGITFMCNDIIDNPFDTLALSVLSYCLFEMPQSIFFQEFLQSGQASKYCPGYGYDITNRISTFTFGFAEVSNDKSELIQMGDKIMKILKEISENGLDVQMVDFAIHYMEVNAKEGKADFGLNLLQNMIPFIIHNKDPTVVLKMEESFEKLRRKIDEGLIQQLVKKYFLNNNHGIRTIITPDNLFTDYVKIEETDYLKTVQERMTIQDIDFLQKENEQVFVEMCKMQDVSILPSLSTSDIVPLVEKFEYEEQVINGINVWFTDQETNGMSYVRIKFDISDLEPELHHFLELFCIVFPHIGSQGLQTNQMDFLIDNYTSKFEMESHIFRDVKGKDQIKKVLVMTVGYLDKYIEQSFSLLNDLLSTPNLKNLSRISELLQYYAGIYANNLGEKPMDIAIAHANSGLSRALFLNDKMKKTQDICSLAIEVLKTTSLKQELEKISYYLECIYHKMINKNRMSILIHSQKKNYKNLQKRIELLSSTIKINQPNFNKSIIIESEKMKEFKETFSRSFIPLPINTNYIVESFKMPEVIDGKTPVMHLVGEVMRNCIHFEEIRSVDGVYDAGCYIDLNGSFSIFSFRDHSTVQRYETFERAIQYITNKDFTERELKEAKISLFSKIDKNVEPYNKGIKWFIYGLNDKLRLNYRQALLAANSQKVIDTANEILLENIMKEQSSQVIIGSQAHNLKKLLSRGWKIEKAVDGISVSPKSYRQNENQKYVYNEFM